MDQCAKEIRQLLMNPQGADMYAKRQAELKETSAKSHYIEQLRANNLNPFDPYTKSNYLIHPLIFPSPTQRSNMRSLMYLYDTIYQYLK
ncbi:MAG: hypothetical protein Q9210_001957 [Variospora velana]